MKKNTVFPRLGVSACVWRDGRVLIVERAKPPLVGFWSLPGGSVEPGETVLDGAVRELQEETGIVAALDHLVGLFDVIRRDEAGVLSAHFVVACYAGLWTGGEAIAASDASRVLWAEERDLASLAFTPCVPEAIAQARDILGIR